MNNTAIYDRCKTRAVDLNQKYAIKTCTYKNDSLSFYIFSRYRSLAINVLHK